MNIKEKINYEDLHEKCGIITAILTDPLSEITSKLLKLKSSDPNSVGFYYNSDISIEKKYTIFLFNIYDNDPISWLKIGYNMDSFISSPFVKNITFYPLGYDKLLLSTRQIYSKKNFRGTVIETIQLNSKVSHDKNLSYKKILSGTLIDNWITGYSLVNRCLLILMGNENVNLYTNPYGIISCPLLKTPVTINSKPENINSFENKNIMEKTKADIKYLIDVAVDLFINNNDFKQHIIDDQGTSKLLDLEENLISFITDGIEKGILDNSILNKIISDINNERFYLGKKQPLLTVKNPSTEVKVISNDGPYTFQHPQIKNNVDYIRELGIQLNDIVKLFNEQENVIIQLGNIISLYNKIIDGTDLQKVELNNNNDLISKQIIATLPGRNTMISHNNICIPMYGANLSLLSEYELMDLLVYIDSLKTNDISFANVQNEITHELALRRKK